MFLSKNKSMLEEILGQFFLPDDEQNIFKIG